MTDDEIVRQHIVRRPRPEWYNTAAEYESELQTWRTKLIRALQAAGRGPSIPHGSRLSTDDGWSGR